MSGFRKFDGIVVALPVDNIDTDQIVPARFLKTTSKAGLAMNLFHDWRYGPDGEPRPEFVLNQPKALGAQILLAGDNFGCGSSREHAPWALTQSGFRAVISTSFADIFRQNALKNALLPIVVEPDVHQDLLKAANREAPLVLSVDLEKQSLGLPDGASVHFPVDAFARNCLLEGVDELGYVLNREADIARFEELKGAWSSGQ